MKALVEVVEVMLAFRGVPPFQGSYSNFPFFPWPRGQGFHRSALRASFHG